MSLPLCENCGRPARYTVSLDSGYETDTCGECRPAAAVEWREVNTAPAPVQALPLTVAQAAAREAVDPRTIYRWLPALEATHGAWKAGAQWRIDPDALDARRATPRPADAPAKRPQRTRRRKPAKVSAGDIGWPA